MDIMTGLGSYTINEYYSERQMKTYKFKKIVYFKDDKTFANRENDVSDFLDDATFYDDELSDETIKSFFNDEFKEQIEIWRVRVTVETM
jgi:hypothetical protein